MYASLSSWKNGCLECQLTICPIISGETYMDLVIDTEKFVKSCTIERMLSLL
jgi:hypothetical protein